jgi:hypothetical protein
VTITDIHTDVDAEIALLARELKTPVIASTFHTLAEQARAETWSHETYLAAVLARQVASRTVNRPGCGRGS